MFARWRFSPSATRDRSPLYAGLGQMPVAGLEMVFFWASFSEFRAIPTREFVMLLICRYNVSWMLI